jgi:polyphosphate kinase
MKAPRVLPRVIRLPDELSKKPGASYCLLSSSSRPTWPTCSPAARWSAYSQFRVTRNSDLWVDEEEVKNLRQALQSELHSRNYGFAVRLEVAAAARATWPTSCSTSSAIDRSRLFSVDGPVNMGRLLEIVNSNARPELRSALRAGLPAKLVNHHDIFAVLASQDMLLHHPFQSFEPVIDFIRSAAPTRTWWRSSRPSTAPA